MQHILVIGASGFVGRHLVQALLEAGYAVRCLVRDPAKVRDSAAGVEIVQGDISDAASVERALAGMDAVYVSIHTLSSQHPNTVGQAFMDIELQGLRNIVAACRTHGVRRLIYVTSLGVAPDASSAWTRERWQAQQFLLGSGLDVTVLQPGQIVGVGGLGFNTMVGQAKQSAALLFAHGKRKCRSIAIDDLVYYLVGVLGDPRTHGQVYEVGCDDVLTYDQMVDVTAELLGRKPPTKIHLPRPILNALAPVMERAGKLPKGAMKAFVDGMADDMIGDPSPIRQVLPRVPLSYRQAVERALAIGAS